jgi:UDP-glucose 4-epimerase
MASVLVTGGAGFIGSHTVERLLAAGHAVTALDNVCSGAWQNLRDAGDAERIELDVRDAERLASLTRARRFDAMIHLAAQVSVPLSVQQPALSHAVNVTGTVNVLEAARTGGVRRVVLASSAAVYGQTPDVAVSECAPVRPSSPYAAQKAAAELLCGAYRHAYGIETVTLRYFNVYGQRQRADSSYAGVVPAFAAGLRAGRTLTVHGDGEQTRDLIHVSDVAALNLLAALGPDPGGEPVNAGTGIATSVLGVLNLLRSLLRVDAALSFAPERTGDVRHSCADIGRMQEVFGYTPRVALRDGLADMLGIG